MGTFVIGTTANGGFRFNLKAGNGQVIATSQTYKGKPSCKNGIKSVQKNAVIAPIEDQTVEGWEKLKHPKFEVYQDKAGEFRFRLKAANGEIIATGEGYVKKTSCLNGIESIRKNAPEAAIKDESE